MLLACPSTQIGFLGISYVTFLAPWTWSSASKTSWWLHCPWASSSRIFSFFRHCLPVRSIGGGDSTRIGNGRSTDRASARTWTRRCIGLSTAFYKFIIAYLIDKYWVQPATAASGFIASLAYMYGYSLYLFFDFAGYSHFAIGLSYLFGIHSPENFNRPFLARNIKDFWNRWHMSLSFWFRDHIYMRFVMRATEGKRGLRTATAQPTWGILFRSD